MKIRLFIKAALFFTVFVSAGLAATAQPQPTPTPQTEPTKVDLVYTGRLLGYFRVPSVQDFKATNGCPVEKTPLNSKAAEQFLKVRDSYVKETTVLVGTGDNFAPELEARVFSNPPSPDGKYAIGNKELYNGGKNSWVFYKDLEDNEQLRKQIEAGQGTIPNDNVACFLRRAGYAAIVPGKHDFYFGAERLRQLARFLAAPGSGDYKPVQMLGANLVMKTVPIESTPVSTKVMADRSFESWPSAFPVLNLKDGQSVYPWFSVIKIKLIELSRKQTSMADGVITHNELDNFISETEVALNAAKPDEAQQASANRKRLATLKESLPRIRTDIGIRICKAEGPGAPNQMPADLGNCHKPRQEIRVSGNSILLYLYPDQAIKADKHFSFAFGKNFGLCTRVPDPKKDKKGTLTNACLRFSSYTPFFYFPQEVPKDGEYVDPEPYAIENNVAVFGVVDPTLGEQVGALNFGWKHGADAELTTRVSVEDPADALQQQLDYFAIRQPNFPGLKVLLAQMTPQRARALAARFPQFQIVVSAADQEQATSNIKMSTNWKPDPQASGQFLATPSPYFNPITREGSVHIGVITATPFKPDESKQTGASGPQHSEKKEELKKTTWELGADAKPGTPVPERDDPATVFWGKVKKLPGCLDSDPRRNEDDESYDNPGYLKLLVLCTMQQHLGSDAALIQRRDLFEKIPALDEKLLNRFMTSKDGPAKNDEEFKANVQQILDRLIWKGDLITLLHVPGSAIKKALAQSDVYASAERATLSLSVDKGRTLETLGIRKNDANEYFINELPIDDNRVYAIATTDYIGAGDTGYPDLVNAARNPRTHPAAFTGDLISISSLVCRKLVQEKHEVDKHCLNPVDSSSYLDTTTAQQIPPYPPEGRFSRLWTGTAISWPDERKESDEPVVALEQRVQRRSFWGFSLKNLSIGVKDLDNNRTDQSLKEKFAGVPTSGVESRENRTLSLGLDTRLSYFADRHEFFSGIGIDYERQSQGDPTLATEVSLNKNRVFADAGFVWWRRPGREFPNLGAVFSVHGETQLEQPFAAFNLKTQAEDQIRITRKRGALVLARLGVRWQNKTNISEVGAQFGRELRALRGYRFENPGDDDPECLVESAQTLGECIETKSTPPDGKITATSIPSALLQGRPRAGIYWNHTFSFPLGSRMKYELTQDADFFFVKFHRDTSIDTRFRYNSRNRLSFLVWPNFSIGPVLELFMYQNKVNRSFLFQRSFGIETKLNFDIFNRREKGAQIRSRP